MIRRYGRPAVASLALLAVIAAWNTLRYPPGLGYDAVDHIAYAESILHGHGFPDGVGEYYTPPGFYAVTAAAIWLGETIGLGSSPRSPSRCLRSGDWRRERAGGPHRTAGARRKNCGRPMKPCTTFPGNSCAPRMRNTGASPASCTIPPRKSSWPWG